MWASGHNGDIKRAAAWGYEQTREAAMAAFAKSMALGNRKTMSIFQRLYDSEINFEVSAFYDAGFDVRLGDHLNGFLAEGKVETWAEGGSASRPSVG